MDYKKAYEQWLNSPALSESEKAELTAIAGDEKEIESRFFSQLEFGTAGLRGTMGVGLYRMNIHVIRHATQAFANVILNEGPESFKKGVAICFDCRNNSDVFAKEAACIMAAAGIPVRLFESLRPTPELSFAIREYGCIAGINITASHNPKEYNGYKVYWSDGAQLPPNHADEVAKIMRESDVFDVKVADYDRAVADGLITIMGSETDEKFLKNVMEQVNDQAAVDAVADTFKMVYTPFHGTGHKLIPEALKRLGMKHVVCVPEQMVIDGNFPTVASPNPENPEGFYLAVDLANKEGADFILGSDPDADRVGLMVNTGNGEFKVLTGNQTGVLLLDYLRPAIATRDVILNALREIDCRDCRSLALLRENWTGENILLSPLSVLSALGMTANGARGETLAQMEAVLGLPVEELNEALAAWTENLPRESVCRADLANALWLRDDGSLAPEEAFLQTAADWSKFG